MDGDLKMSLQRCTADQTTEEWKGKCLYIQKMKHISGDKETSIYSFGSLGKNKICIGHVFPTTNTISRGSDDQAKLCIGKVYVLDKTNDEWTRYSGSFRVVDGTPIRLGNDIFDLEPNASHTEGGESTAPIVLADKSCTPESSVLRSRHASEANLPPYVADLPGPPPYQEEEWTSTTFRSADECGLADTLTLHPIRNLHRFIVCTESGDTELLRRSDYFGLRNDHSIEMTRWQVWHFRSEAPESTMATTKSAVMKKFKGKARELFSAGGRSGSSSTR